ncbi:efflux transporter outer membrane subunit [Desulfoferrobacter suflitae]|uniref:efflux transporter outer membrane subunit n=1 Tax=Desulfoferrobacter suflitae TaxID=2865782 RepID=UPI002164E246|nr:efflux transporter outer membrane subunit [Desulfoferrobacter suflitae]MCK8603148.1 efflux transporter outer membrane subunit [Desulfoferrobacter suflitae]
MVPCYQRLEKMQVMSSQWKSKKIAHWALLPVLSIMLMNLGCATVGPDYASPNLSAPEAWHAELEGGLRAKPVDPETLGHWWSVLNDPVLSSLISQAVVGNLDLKVARARVRQARANRRINQANWFPTMDAVGSFRKSRSSENSGSGTETDLSAVGFDAVWELDIFGGTRRSVEAATADLQAISEDLHDVLVTLLAEVALNYVEARTFQVRLAVAEQNLRAQQETYQLTSWRSQAGLTTDLAVQQAKYNLESTRSQIPTLRTGLEGAMNRIAVLLGRHPGALHKILEEPRPIPAARMEVTVGVPADTLRHRPDVRRAERQLAAQTARVGVAVAELYPKLTLLGSIGVESLTVSDLFVPGSRTYSFGPSISWPIFNAGAIRSNIEAQSALQEQALGEYEGTVLSALEEVENALVAYVQEQNRRQALAESAQAAKIAVQLAETQFEAGLIDFNNVLDAQRSLLTFQDQLAESQGTVTSNLIRLYKALGGGWTSLARAATQ